MARLTAAACRHALSAPCGSHMAAASAAMSAPACARCRATTALPIWIPATAIDTNAAIRIAANTVAAPRSSRARLGGRDGVGSDGDARQQPGVAADCRDDEAAVATELQRRPGRSDPAGRGHRARLVAAGRQPRRLPGSVDAADLHRHRGEAAGADNEHRHQRGDGNRRFDGGETGVTA